MEKKEQLLVISPATELKFRGPFNQAITSHMRLSNPTDDKKILFKIKTTAPKKYCVRPNCGQLDPGASVEVSICLQPFVFDPNEKNKHKFMVQSLVAPDDDSVPHDQLWKDITPDQLMDSKLRCVFEVPVDKVTQVKQEANQSTLQTSSDFIKAETSSTVAETELSQLSDGLSPDQAVAAEIKQLRAEALHLRMENVKLKEEVQQKRYADDARQGGDVAFQNPYKPPLAQSQQLMPMHIAITVAVAIFALLLGKFLL